MPSSCDVVVAFAALIQIQVERNKEKKKQKKNLSWKENGKEFTIFRISLLALLLSSEIIQPDIFYILIHIH